MSGAVYVGLVGLAAFLVVCVACLGMKLYAAWVAYERAEECEICGGSGVFPQYGSDGRLTGSRFHCECQSLHNRGRALDMRF